MQVINALDNVMAAIALSIKVAKFVMRVLHLLLLAIGYVSIAVCVGIYLAYQHWSGKQTAQVDVAEAEHGPVNTEAEYAAPDQISPEDWDVECELVYARNLAQSLNIVGWQTMNQEELDWALDDELIPPADDRLLEAEFAWERDMAIAA